MRKLLCMLTALAILIPLFGCNNEPEQVDNATTVESTTNTQLPVAGAAAEPDDSDTVLASRTETGNVFLDAELQNSPVMNGMETNVIGSRAYISIDKADAVDASMDEFMDFVSERVVDSGYNWWTVFFEDGTGIVFAGSMSYVVEYGQVGSDGTLVDGYGAIIYQEDGTYNYIEYEP